LGEVGDQGTAVPAVTEGEIVDGAAAGGDVRVGVGGVEVGTAVDVTGAVVVGTPRAAVVGVALRGLLVRTTGAAVGR
jgi:hypothetical protein